MCKNEYVKECLKINSRMLLKLDRDLQNCYTLLIAVKLRIAALKVQMFALRTMYQDLMELRHLILILNPHLKKISPK